MRKSLLVVVLLLPLSAVAQEDGPKHGGDCVNPPDCAQRLASDLADVFTTATLEKMLVEDDAATARARMIDGCTAEQRAKLSKQLYSTGFTADEKAVVREVLASYQPLLEACPNIPLPKIVRAPPLRACDQPLRDEPGEGFTMEDASVTFFAKAPDAPRDDSNPEVQREWWNFSSTVAHELAHAFTLRFDPRTCTEYDSWMRNPLIADYLDDFHPSPTRVGVDFIDAGLMQESMADIAERLIIDGDEPETDEEKFVQSLLKLDHPALTKR